MSVIAFECELCKRLHRAEEEARKCCTCDKCGTKFLAGRRSGWSATCEHCLHAVRIRAARKGVRDAEERLESAKQQLAKMLAEPRPEKGVRS